MLTLRELLDRHTGKVSDKWTGYIDYYDALFRPFRNEQITLLEIGVQNGGSLEVWSQYFPSARRIVGCDIDSAAAHLKFRDARIEIVVGDATLPSTVAMLPTENDIIIDDGSHLPRDICRGFCQLFGRVKPGGLYIIEDLHCSYWSGWQGGLSQPAAAMEFLRRLTDLVNFPHWGVEGLTRADALSDFAREYDLDFDESVLASIGEVRFRDSLCVISRKTRATSDLGSRLVVGTEAEIVQDVLKHGNTLDIPSQRDNPFASVYSRIDAAAELNDLSAALAALRATAEQDKARLAEVTVDLAASENRVAERDASIEALNRENKSVRGQADAASARAAAAEHVVTEVLASTSWRITAPLRRLAARFRR